LILVDIDVVPGVHGRQLLYHQQAGQG